MPRILVLEDYEPLARALRRTLSLGWAEGATDAVQVTVAQTCEAAYATADWFDLAVFDLELPDGSGVEVARTLLRDGKVGDVTFFTACRDADQIRAAAALGRVVDKAAGMTLLLSTLRSGREGQALQRAVGDEAPPPAFGRVLSGRSGTRRIGG